MTLSKLLQDQRKVCYVLFRIVSYTTLVIIVDEIDYTLFNQTITFVGNYSLGDSECAVMNVTTIDDNIVEGTEVISVFITPGLTATISIFIIDNDCRTFQILQQ